MDIVALSCKWRVMIGFPSLRKSSKKSPKGAKESWEIPLEFPSLGINTLKDTHISILQHCPIFADIKHIFEKSGIAVRGKIQS